MCWVFHTLRWHHTSTKGVRFVFQRPCLVSGGCSRHLLDGISIRLWNSWMVTWMRKLPSEQQSGVSFWVTYPSNSPPVRWLRKKGRQGICEEGRRRSQRYNRLRRPQQLSNGKRVFPACRIQQGRRRRGPPAVTTITSIPVTSLKYCEDYSTLGKL